MLKRTESGLQSTYESVDDLSLHVIQKRLILGCQHCHSSTLCSLIGADVLTVCWLQSCSRNSSGSVPCKRRSRTLVSLLSLLTWCKDEVTECRVRGTTPGVFMLVLKKTHVYKRSPCGSLICDSVRILCLLRVPESCWLRYEISDKINVIGVKQGK